MTTPLQLVEQDGARLDAFLEDYDQYLVSRRSAILGALKDEPLSRDEAIELIDELAEIQTKIGKE